MMQKTIGRYNDRISILGFGSGRLPEIEIHGVSYPEQDKINEMVQYAYENGVNYFDTAPLYCSGNCETAIGEAVKHFRKNIFLAGKLQGEQVKAGKQLYALESTLKKLNTDYLDYYYFWGINWFFFKDYIIQNHVLQDIVKCQEEGLIRNIAFSFHGKPEELAWIIDRTQEICYE